MGQVRDEAALRRPLDELAEFGRENDGRETERSRRMLNITPGVGRLLSMLVRREHTSTTARPRTRVDSTLRPDPSESARVAKPIWRWSAECT